MAKLDVRLTKVESGIAALGNVLELVQSPDGRYQADDAQSYSTVDLPHLMGRYRAVIIWRSPQAKTELSAIFQGPNYEKYLAGPRESLGRPGGIRWRRLIPSGQCRQQVNIAGNYSRNKSG